MMKLIEKIGRTWTSVLVTLLSVTLTQLIVRGLYAVNGRTMELVSVASSLAAPLLIAPTFSWLFFGMLLKLNSLEREMRSLASFDPLTGLYNRYTFYSVANQLLSLMRREGARLSALFVDIDHFKRVNDRYGHFAGDVVLKEIARLLRETIRTSDMIGRIGGEEFVILLPRTGPEDAATVAEKLRRSVERRQITIGLETAISATISVGVAGGPVGLESCVDELVNLADKELYRAKSSGRNRICVLDLGDAAGQAIDRARAEEVRIPG